MRHSRKSRNSNLHSENRHRNRNHKRRVRNLFLEIIFITILIFIANKFIKNDEEKAHVKQLSVENQKQQIEKELQENNIKKDNTKKENTKELEIPQQDKKGIRITKVNITCDEGKTIIDFTVKNYNEEEAGEMLLVGLLNNSAKIIEKIYVDVPILKSQQQTKINLVVDKDLTEAEKIELLEEQ